MKGVAAVTLLPTEANSDATIAMAARLMLGRPTAPAKNWPSPQAAMPNARAKDMLSTLGAAETAAFVLALLAAVRSSAVLDVMVSTHACPITQAALM